MEQVRGFGASETGKPSEATVDTRSVLTCKMVDGKRDAEARLVAKGYQGPDLEAGPAETSGV